LSVLVHIFFSRSVIAVRLGPSYVSPPIRLTPHLALNTRLPMSQPRDDSAARSHANPKRNPYASASPTVMQLLHIRYAQKTLPHPQALRLSRDIERGTAERQPRREDGKPSIQSLASYRKQRDTASTTTVNGERSIAFLGDGLGGTKQ